MNLSLANSLGQRLVAKHLSTRGWRFVINYQLTTTFGYCRPRDKTIELSASLTSANDEEEVFDTILHEIAHALVGCRHGHDWVWKQKAIELGCKPNRFYNLETVTDPNVHRCWRTYEHGDTIQVNWYTRRRGREVLKGVFQGYNSRASKYPILFTYFGRNYKASPNQIVDLSQETTPFAARTMQVFETSERVEVATPEVECVDEQSIVLRITDPYRELIEQMKRAAEHIEEDGLLIFDRFQAESVFQVLSDIAIKFRDPQKGRLIERLKIEIEAKQC